MWDWSDVFNTADLHARTSKSTQSTLSTRAGSLGLSSTRGTQLNVKSVDAKSSALFGDVLGSQHGSIGARLITISLHFHATSNASNRFTTERREKLGGLEYKNARIRNKTLTVRTSQ